MKFDKETIIVLIAAGALLLGWVMFYQQPQKQTVQPVQTVQSVAAQSAKPAAEAVASAGIQGKLEPAVKNGNLSVSAAAPAAVPAVLKPVSAGLENEKVRFVFDALTGTVTGVELKNHRKSISEDTNLFLTVPEGSVRTFETNLFSAPVQPEQVIPEKNSCKIVRNLDGIRVIQTFTLPEDSYNLDVSCTLVNTTSGDRIIPELVVWTAGIPPMQALSGDKVNSVRHNVDYCLAPKHTVKSFSPDADEPEETVKKETGEPLYWLGSTNKYFASLLFMKDGAEFNGGLRLKQTAVNANGQKFALPFAGGAIKNIQLPAGSAKTYHFQYYCGPKEIKQIKTLPESAMEAMHIACWSWFEFIARPLAKFLVLLYDWVGNYGLAIILLTVIVRLIFWPVTQKANNSMRRMQKIQPQMKALREKYKSNPQELNMRMMELYKQEKVNPLGGCLPMLLQLPIFFALYSVFDSAVELRHVSFLWAKDLAQPDQVGPVLNFLGFDLALHPWIIMMTILMIVQQKMTPSQGDPAQQKIMMAMPVIMLVMLYWLPSGLTLYWTVSQLFSIIQLKYGQYIAAKEEAKEKSSRTTATK